jgi:hypothetical protein
VFVGEAQDDLAQAVRQHRVTRLDSSSSWWLPTASQRPTPS